MTKRFSDLSSQLSAKLKDDERILGGALWFLATAGSVYLVVRRYNEFSGVVPTGPRGVAGDFWTFLHAARMIGAGKSPYNFSVLAAGGGYVYSALVALALLPFSHASNVHIWHVWTALSIVSVVICGGLVTWGEAPRLQSWQRPVLFGLTVITAFQFLPTTWEFENGQTDTYVLVMLALAVLMSLQRRAFASGVFSGVGALIKSWPVGAALTLLRRGYLNRRRAFVGLIITLLLGPLLAVSIGGASGLANFVKVTVDARSQNIPNFSVWGIPKLLFSRSGLARPLLVSAPLEILTMVLLAAVVIGLIATTLTWSNDPSLSFWNVVACVVLLLPVSHFDYTMYFLPILWIWIARWFTDMKFASPTFLVAGLLVVWWLITFNFGLDYALSSPSSHFAVTFLANLAAVAISVCGSLYSGNSQKMTKYARNVIEAGL